MSTEANFVGGDDSAKSFQKNGQNIEEAVNSTPSTANSGGSDLSPETPPDPTAEIFANPWTDVWGAFRYQGHTYVKLETQLEDVTNSWDTFNTFKDYLLDIIAQYQVSPTYLADEDPDKFTRIADVYSMVMLMLNRAAQTKLGFQSNRPTTTPDNLKENVFQPDAFNILTNNPANFEDLALFKEWVGRLQGMCTAMMGMNANLTKLLDPKQELIEAMKKALENHEKIDAGNQKIIDGLRAQIAEETAPKPKYALSLSVSVSTPYRGTSEADILYFALDEYRTSRQGMFKEEIGQGEFTNAYCSHTDAQIAIDLLNALRESAVELAEHNYEAAKYNGNDADYRRAVEREKASFFQDRTEFLSLYSVDIAEAKPRTDSEIEEAITYAGSAPADLSPRQKDQLNDFGLYPADGTFLLDMRDAGATDEEISRFSELLKKRNTDISPAE